jgi:hypothetical protein
LTLAGHKVQVLPDAKCVAADQAALRTIEQALG